MFNELFYKKEAFTEPLLFNVSECYVSITPQFLLSGCQSACSLNHKERLKYRICNNADL